jgi:3-phosphoshikimate 1-carboxyvinyltransferase
LNLFAKPSASISGEVICPGDKSISQRAVILGSLLNEDIAIEGFLNGEDPISTANALNAIGSSITINGTSVIIEKRNTPFKKPETEVDLGNSGTGMRLMMGLISSLNIDATLVGDESLTKRPMLRIANPLNEMGASIACNEGKPPIKISPGKILDNYTYEMPIASAQVKSGIILSALAANKSVTVIEKHPTRNHTERMISHFHGNIETAAYEAGNKIIYTPSKLIPSKSYRVVGDFSSAAFLIVAGLIAKESNIVIKNVGLNPTRCGLIDVLKSMGGSIEIKNEKVISYEEVGDIHVRSSALKGVSISGDVIPNIIDEIPILSIAAAFAEGETSISDAEELRVKESDRLQAISDGLIKINVSHQLYNDGIKITGSSQDIVDSAEIDSHGDHRIAMSFLIASLRSTSGVFVKDCKNIFTSFPHFIEVMKTLGIDVDER